MIFYTCSLHKVLMYKTQFFCPKISPSQSYVSQNHNLGPKAHLFNKFVGVLQEAEDRFTKALEYHPKVGQYYISRSRARYMMEVCNALLKYYIVL